jgi:CspA family cold shock protein
MVGTVVEFDEPAGYGHVANDTDPDGGRWFFHCTAIADGTRTIEVGARVRFELVPGHQGRYEATDLRPA